MSFVSWETPNFLATMAMGHLGRQHIQGVPRPWNQLFLWSFNHRSYLNIGWAGCPVAAEGSGSWKAFVQYCQVQQFFSSLYNVNITLSNIFCTHKYVCFGIVYQMRLLVSLIGVHQKSYGSETRPCHCFWTRESNIYK